MGKKKKKKKKKTRCFRKNLTEKSFEVKNEKEHRGDFRDKGGKAQVGKKKKTNTFRARRYLQKEGGVLMRNNKYRREEDKKVGVISRKSRGEDMYGERTSRVDSNSRRLN